MKTNNINLVTLKLVKHKLKKILNKVKCTECSRNLKFEKRTDQNFFHTKSPSRKGILHFEEKKTVKAMSKGGYYEYILAFAGWRSIFWEMVGSGGYILAGGVWCWWVVVGSGRHILAGGGWWWMVVDGGGWCWTYFGWWWVVA